MESDWHWNPWYYGIPTTWIGGRFIRLCSRWLTYPLPAVIGASTVDPDGYILLENGLLVGDKVYAGTTSFVVQGYPFPYGLVVEPDGHGD